MNYSLYIPSKGRADKCLVADIFIAEKLDFRIVVEPQDSQEYLNKYPNNCLIIDANDMGMYYVRNWIKKYSTKKGELFHWQFDDNIKSFRHRKDNKNVKVTASFCINNAERFVNSFTNIGMAGFSYTTFAFGLKGEYGLNKQISSGMLINNELPIYRNPDIIEDTDYSLQVLMYDNYKWCTVLFNTLLIEKTKSGVMKGGCTEIEHNQDKREKRINNLVEKYKGAFTTRVSGGRLRVSPSRIWKKFPQTLIPK